MGPTDPTGLAGPRGLAGLVRYKRDSLWQKQDVMPPKASTATPSGAAAKLDAATPHMLVYDAFPPIYTGIRLPENSYFYRGYDTAYAAVSERPAYYSPALKIANGYGNKNDRHTVGVFRTTRPLRLYDIRYLSALLREYIRQRDAARDPDGAANAAIHTASLALGLCSFRAQLALFRLRYRANLTEPSIAESLAAMESYEKNPPANRNPVELEGVRVGEGTNDAELAVLLARLFGHTVDGYIAPAIQTPYHTEKGGWLNSEIMIFNPRRSGITEVPGGPEALVALRDLRVYPIRALLESDPDSYHMECYDYARVYAPPPRAVGGSGGTSSRSQPPILHASAILDAGGRRYAALRKRMEISADAWAQSLPWPSAGFQHPNPIHRCSPWNIGPDGSLQELKELCDS